ncbi:MAG: ComEC/Rec2 family competence protein [Flavobacteriales bacterium]|nr:ComEC/Rec2 family competence protein [Flavobacteriales bacterium]MDW8432718.1 ComEC/Rec2 family competence protein [Flavobacteriales bacterium]
MSRPPHLLFDPPARAFSSVPMLRPAILLALGIWAGSASPCALEESAVWGMLLCVFALLAGLFFAPLISRSYGKTSPQTFWPFLVFPVLGFVLFVQSEKNRGPVYVSAEYQKRTLVVEEPWSLKRYGWEVKGLLRIRDPEEKKIVWQKYQITMDGNLGSPPQAEPGDTLFFSGPILPLPPAKFPGGYDGRKQGQRGGVQSATRLYSLQSLALTKGQRNKNFFHKVRTFCQEKAGRYFLDDNARGIVLQMLLGIRSELDEDTRQAFRNTGVMHILAVSGLHVGIIYLVLVLLGKPLLPNRPLTRWLWTLLTLAVVWVYAALAGMRPSVMRAAWMLSILALGRLASRPVPLLNALAVAAFVNLVWRPQDLFDLGFMLSYAAVAGIALLYEPLVSLWSPKQLVLKKLWELSCVSVSAQAATTGIALVYFERFPTYFVVANWLAVPAASVILYAGLVFFLLPGGLISDMMSRALELFIQILTKTLKLLDDAPGAVMSITLNPAQAAFWTVMLFLFVGMLAYPGFQRVKMCFVAVLVGQIFFLLCDVWTGFQKPRWALWGGRLAGVYVTRGSVARPALSPNSLPGEAAAVRLSAEGMDTLVVVFKPQYAVSDWGGSRQVWYFKNRFTEPPIRQLSNISEIWLGPDISARKALILKKKLNEHGMKVHAVNLDGFLTSN